MPESRPDVIVVRTRPQSGPPAVLLLIYYYIVYTPVASRPRATFPSCSIPARSVVSDLVRVTAAGRASQTSESHRLRT